MPSSLPSKQTTIAHFSRGLASPSCQLCCQLKRCLCLLPPLSRYEMIHGIRTGSTPLQRRTKENTRYTHLPKPVSRGKHVTWKARELSPYRGAVCRLEVGWGKETGVIIFWCYPTTRTCLLTLPESLMAWGSQYQREKTAWVGVCCMWGLQYLQRICTCTVNLTHIKQVYSLLYLERGKKIKKFGQ